MYGQGFWSAAFAQFLIGAALGGTYMPGLKALTDHLEGPAQSRATAFYTASFGIGSTISILVAGKIGATLAGNGRSGSARSVRCCGGLLVMFAMPMGRMRPREHHTTALLDFRPVLRNRKTLPYVIGYAAAQLRTVRPALLDGRLPGVLRGTAARTRADGALRGDAGGDDQRDGAGVQRQRQ